LLRSNRTVIAPPFTRQGRRLRRARPMRRDQEAALESSTTADYVVSYDPATHQPNHCVEI
jgi:hypothetical protein